MPRMPQKYPASIFSLTNKSKEQAYQEWLDVKNGRDSARQPPLSDIPPHEKKSEDIRVDDWYEGMCWVLYSQKGDYYRPRQGLSKEFFEQDILLCKATLKAYSPILIRIVHPATVLATYEPNQSQEKQSKINRLYKLNFRESAKTSASNDTYSLFQRIKQAIRHIRSPKKEITSLEIHQTTCPDCKGLIFYTDKPQCHRCNPAT